MRVQARKQRGAGGAAAARIVKLGETQSARRKLVEVGRGNFAAVAADVAEAHIVDEDHDDIGPRCFGSSAGQPACASSSVAIAASKGFTVALSNRCRSAEGTVRLTVRLPDFLAGPSVSTSLPFRVNIAYQSIPSAGRSRGRRRFGSLRPLLFVDPVSRDARCLRPVGCEDDHLGGLFAVLERKLVADGEGLGAPGLRRSLRSNDCDGFLVLLSACLAVFGPCRSIRPDSRRSIFDLNSSAAASQAREDPPRSPDGATSRPTPPLPSPTSLARPEARLGLGFSSAGPGWAGFAEAGKMGFSKIVTGVPAGGKRSAKASKVRKSGLLKPAYIGRSSSATGELRMQIVSPLSAS